MAAKIISFDEEARRALERGMDGGGVGVAAALMYYEKWRHPEDPSAVSVGIIVMLTFPLGLLLGLAAGGLFADRWIKRGNEKTAGFDVVTSRGERAAR